MKKLTIKQQRTELEKMYFASLKTWRSTKSQRDAALYMQLENILVNIFGYSEDQILILKSKSI